MDANALLPMLSRKPEVPMGITFPGESAEYRTARNSLLEREIELRRQIEDVAARRRALPPGGLLKQDYVFDVMANSHPAKIKFSELFHPGTNTLITYHFMFPRYPADKRDAPKLGETAKLKKADTPCPSCSALIDSLDGAAEHVEAAGFNFVIVANTSIDRLATFAGDRGWTHARFVSSANNSFKRDYHGEIEGGQQPLTTVFHRYPDGIRHFWSSEMLYAKADPGQDHRGNGLIDTIWNMMDLTPEGRPAGFKIQPQYQMPSDVPERAPTLSPN
jgi:predicted dithiol-disulfide oxidoreductase (DUF899 family)